MSTPRLKSRQGEGTSPTAIDLLEMVRFPNYPSRSLNFLPCRPCRPCLPLLVRVPWAREPRQGRTACLPCPISTHHFNPPSARQFVICQVVCCEGILAIALIRV